MPEDNDYNKITKATSSTAISTNSSKVRVTSDQQVMNRRPFGHVLKHSVYFLGLWLYMLLAVCIPYGKNAEYVSDQLHTSAYYMISSGSGVLQGCSLFFVIHGCIGPHRGKILGYMFIAMYLLGGILLIIGRGIATSFFWSCKSDHKCKYDGSEAAFRTMSIGFLCGEVSFTVMGMLLALPDYGLMHY